MGDIKALSERDAIKKMQSIAGHEVAMMCTSSGNQAMNTRPMQTLKIDDDGCFWFMSKKGSTKNQEIVADSKVQLCYSVPGKSAYLSVHGTATISRDQKKIDELWSPLARAWFPEGKDDPNITVIKVSAICGHYWDIKHNKMVQVAAVAMGAITGKPLDDSIQGALRV
jgi:general stress protein 26